MLDQLVLLSSLRNQHLDLATGLQGERLGQECAVGRIVGQEDQAGDRLALVELAKEGVQDAALLVRRLDGVGYPREVGAVAPVLPGAEEEDLHAGLPALGMHGEDIGLGKRLWIDRLVLADRRQRADAVAQA